jgi:uncharacterized protein (DUF427 family)
MAVRMRELWASALPETRVHPSPKWVRATIGDRVVVDTKSALLVWEPRRVVPSYAVPVGDLAAELVPYDGAAADERPVPLDIVDKPVLDPSSPFLAHSSPGQSWTLRTPDGDRPAAAFAPEDPDLEGYVVLDWSAFTRWLEEDEEVTAHPRDPFDRIDCLRSSRHVTISLDGVTLADSRRPTLLFETPLPTRYYLPREDVAMELFHPSERRTLCAYKGQARYWSADVGGRLVKDLAWSYEQPRHDAAPVRDLVAFFTERLDLVVDGAPLERPRTPWS